MFSASMKRRIEGLSRKEEYAEVANAAPGTLFKIFNRSCIIENEFHYGQTINFEISCWKNYEGELVIVMEMEGYYTKDFSMIMCGQQIYGRFVLVKQSLKDRNGKEHFVKISTHSLLNHLSNIYYEYSKTESVTVDDMEHDAIAMIKHLCELITEYERKKDEK